MFLSCLNVDGIRIKQRSPPQRYDFFETSYHAAETVSYRDSDGYIPRYHSNCKETLRSSLPLSGSCKPYALTQQSRTGSTYHWFRFGETKSAFFPSARGLRTTNAPQRVPAKHMCHPAFSVATAVSRSSPSTLLLHNIISYSVSFCQELFINFPGKFNVFFLYRLLVIKACFAGFFRKRSLATHRGTR